MRLTRGAATIVVGAATLLLVACGRDAPPPPRDSTTTPPPPPANSLEVTPDPQAWDASYGGILVINDSASRVADVVFPEFTENMSLDGKSFDLRRASAVQMQLFSPSGASGEVTLTASAAADSGCPRWPSATVPAGGSAPEGWTIGLVSGRAAPITLVPIGSLSRADSARLAADLARLASGLPNDTAAALQGVPFVVRNAWRFAPATGVQGVAAIVSRRLNVEATPLEERLLLVAERDSGSTGPYVTRWSDRASAKEDDVAVSDVLAAVTLGATPAIVISREQGEGVAYWLLERRGAGDWRVRWRSAVVVGC